VRETLIFVNGKAKQPVFAAQSKANSLASRPKGKQHLHVQPIPNSQSHPNWSEESINLLPLLSATSWIRGKHSDSLQQPVRVWPQQDQLRYRPLKVALEDWNHAQRSFRRCKSSLPSSRTSVLLSFISPYLVNSDPEPRSKKPQANSWAPSTQPDAWVDSPACQLKADVSLLKA
jgi:hypothetical protein